MLSPKIAQQMFQKGVSSLHGHRSAAQQFQYIHHLLLEVTLD